MRAVGRSNFLDYVGSYAENYVGAEPCHSSRRERTTGVCCIVISRKTEGGRKVESREFLAAASSKFISRSLRNFSIV